MSIRLQDLLQRSNERVHLLVRADRDAQVIVDARQFEIADEDTLFAQGRENFGRRLFRVGRKQEVGQRWRDLETERAKLVCCSVARRSNLAVEMSVSEPKA